MPNTIDTVVFDIGNVLIPWNPKWLYRKLLDSDEAIDHFLAEVDFHAWNAEQDAGRSFAEGLAVQGARHPHLAPLLRAYAERWPEALGHPIEDSLALLRQFKADGYRVLALTNWSAETFPIARQRYAFLDEFEGIIVSGVERLIKPQREIYALLCQRYAVVPGNAVFIDDSAKNVAAARDFGLHAVHYTDAASARAALRALGLAC